MGGPVDVRSDPATPAKDPMCVARAGNQRPCHESSLATPTERLCPVLGAFLRAPACRLYVSNTTTSAAGDAGRDLLPDIVGQEFMGVGGEVLAGNKNVGRRSVPSRHLHCNSLAPTPSRRLRQHHGRIHICPR